MTDKCDKMVFQRTLIMMNLKRAYISGIIFSVVVPFAMVLVWATHAFGMFTGSALVGMIGFGMLQVAYCMVIYCSFKKAETHICYYLYISYYVVTITGFSVVALYDFYVSGSVFLYVVLAFYFIFVPVLENANRLVFVVVQTFAVAGFCVYTGCADARRMAEFGILQVVTVILSGYQHNLASKMQRITSDLKKRTITSEHDALTGLMNRRGLEKKAMAIWPWCQRNHIPVALIALDIDFFKKYNDAFGHPQGDECLKIIAEALTESARRSTDIITRTGGEEFLIFVQNMSDKNLIALALKIKKCVAKKAVPHAYCEVAQYVTVSIGIARTVPDEEMSFNELYEEADQALYQAKKHGRNCIVFEGNLYGRIKNGIAQAISM